MPEPGYFDGWIKVGAKSYRHHCGALVTKLGKQWIATSIDGTAFSGQPTALQAMSYVKEHDSSFWSYGGGGWGGGYHCIGFALGFLDADRQARGEGAFVCHLEGPNELPALLKPVFKKHLFGKIRCNRCLSPMTGHETRILREFHGSHSTESDYFVCTCGYPVWSANEGLCNTLIGAIRRAETSWRREKRIKAAGGKHTTREIHEVLALQDNRCIYCNTQFTSEIRPTKDHLLAAADGGTNWALNIVMACRRCNSRRNDIPFRTYCRLLSQRQNRRILAHLERRLVALDLQSVPSEAMGSFDKGLAHHDPKHPRFLNIQDRSAVARRNAIGNQLLPCTRSRVLKKGARNGASMNTRSRQRTRAKLPTRKLRQPH